MRSALLRRATALSRLRVGSITTRMLTQPRAPSQSMVNRSRMRWVHHKEVLLRRSKMSGEGIGVRFQERVHLFRAVSFAFGSAFSDSTLQEHPEDLEDIIAMPKRTLSSADAGTSAKRNKTSGTTAPTTSTSAPTHRRGYLFRVQIRCTTSPDVTRVVRVPADITFDGFHQVLQETFDWDDAHMYTFEISIIPQKELDKLKKAARENGAGSEQNDSTEGTNEESDGRTSDPGTLTEHGLPNLSEQEGVSSSAALPTVLPTTAALTEAANLTGLPGPDLTELASLQLEPDDDDDVGPEHGKTRASRDVKLSQVYDNPYWLAKGLRTVYEYDIGDSWEHKINFLGVAPPALGLALGEGLVQDIF